MWAVVVVALMAAPLAWTLTPLRELVQPRALLTALSAFGGHDAAPWLALGGFLVGALLLLPVTVMIVVTIAAFGPLAGFLYALVGTTLAAVLNFAIGRMLGQRQVERLAGSRLHAVSMKLRNAGVITVASVRMVPVTPFAIVSLVAGASHIRVRDFIVGTLLGMAPGIGAIAIFSRQLALAGRQPSAEHLLWLAGVSLAMFAALLGARTLARRL